MQKVSGSHGTNTRAVGGSAEVPQRQVPLQRGAPAQEAESELCLRSVSSARQSGKGAVTHEFCFATLEWSLAVELVLPTLEPDVMLIQPICGFMTKSLEAGR